MNWHLGRVGALPYGMALKGLQASARALSGSPAIWARNSYVFGTLVPLVSDLDITVWYEREPTRDAIRALAVFLKAAKKAVPFLGEANVYVASEVEELKSLINRFELERDPELGRRLQGAADPAITVRIQSAAFLLRMLEADLKNLLNRPLERQRKWDGHFAKITALTQVPLTPILKGFPGRSAVRGVVEVIAGMLDEIESTPSLEAYFECVGRGVPWHILKPLSEHNPLWIAAMPHRFLEVAPGKGTERRNQLTAAQLGWELWGVMSQYRLATDERLSLHVEALAGLAREAFGNRSSLVVCADTLLARIRNRG